MKQNLKPVTLFVFLITMSVSAFAVGTEPYALYYLDQDKNVCKLLLDSSGMPVPEPKKLTSGTIFDDFSVSPDEKQIVGFREGKRCEGQPVRCFFWKPGKHMTPFTDPDMFEIPAVQWINGGRYAVMSHPWNEYLVVSTGRAKAVYKESDTSPDGRYYAHGWDAESHIYLAITDTKDGSQMQKPSERSLFAWIGNSGRFAWTNEWGALFIGNAERDEDRELHGDGVASLCYVPRRGLYFGVEGPNGLL